MMFTLRRHLSSSAADERKSLQQKQTSNRQTIALNVVCTMMSLIETNVEILRCLLCDTTQDETNKDAKIDDAVHSDNTIKANKLQPI